MSIIKVLLVSLFLFSTAQAEDDCENMTASEKIRAGCDISVGYELNVQKSKKRSAAEECEDLEISKMTSNCVDVKDSLGITPLIHAVRDGRKKDVIALLKKGADVDLKDSSGNTPLMVAVANGMSDIFSILLAADANVRPKNNMGNTALSLSQQSGDAEMEVLILSRLPSPKFCDYSYEEIGNYYFVARDLTKSDSSVNLKNFKNELERLSAEENYNLQCGTQDEEESDEDSEEESDAGN